MIRYTIRVEGEASRNPNRLLFRVAIVRALEGKEAREIALFHAGYGVEMTDQIIANELWRRVEDFAQVDSNQIRKEAHELRANTIAAALTDRSLEF